MAKKPKKNELLRNDQETDVLDLMNRLEISIRDKMTTSKAFSPTRNSWHASLLALEAVNYHINRAISESRNQQ